MSTVALSGLEPPFEVLGCSWPLPVQHADWRWCSAPEWDAPRLPTPPRLRLEVLEGHIGWTIDWRDLFRADVKLNDPFYSGQMRGFHVVFRLGMRRTGRLVVWDDDGSIVRRNGTVVHEDRSAHARQRHELDVCAGDVLEVAQWQVGWDWLWSAYLDDGDGAALTVDGLVAPIRDAVQHRLDAPTGPPLKMFTNAASPLRVLLAIYSMVLNGYAPSGVHLFGDHQWSARAQHLLRWGLPFAEIHPTPAVLDRLRTLGGPGLASLARQHWFVLKTCVGVLCEPREACMLDDDVVILDRVDDALAAFERSDLVFAADQDHGPAYAATWRISHLGRPPWPLPTARFNAGLYWVRPAHDPAHLAQQMLMARPNPAAPFYWEQGFIAVAYASLRTCELPSQRYFFPLFDGLPGGVLDYDYATNPCRFASIHYGGLRNKPSDDGALELLLPVVQHACATAGAAC